MSEYSHKKDVDGQPMNSASAPTNLNSVEKGKQRASSSIQANHSTDGPSPSFSSRVLSSAATLSRDAFTGNALASTNTLANGLQSSEKAGPSTFQQTAFNEASQQTAAATTSSTRNGKHSTPSESFKTSTSSSTAPADVEFTSFSGFSRTRQDESTNHKSSIPISNAWEVALGLNDLDEAADMSQFERAWNKDTPSMISSITRPDDGMEVVSLLNQPLEFSDLRGTTQEETKTNEPEASDFFTFEQNRMSAQERDIAQKIRNTLGPPPLQASSASAGEDNPLALIPGEDTAEFMTGNSNNMDGTTAHLIDTWRQLLGRYTDEVWGEKLPSVTEARGILDSLGGEDLSRDTHPPPPLEGDERTRALRRLRQLMAHLDTPGKGQNPVLRGGGANPYDPVTS